MNAISRIAVAALAGAFALSAAVAHEGHDHGAEPVPVAKVLPRAQAASADFEIVVVAQGDRLALHLDRFATNEPVRGAKLEVDVGGRKFPATEREPGTYDVVHVLPAGRSEFTVTIEAGDAVDLLPLALEVPAEPAAAPASSAPPWRLLLLAAALAVAAGIVAWRRGRRSVAAALLAVVAIAGQDDVRAADANAVPVPASRVAEPPQRLPDGSVFVPKPAQRVYGLRTVVAEAQELPRVLEFKGHVLADPNAGGQVQATVGGRLEPGPKGLPVLGQRVAKGEVLAWVQPARDPLARATARGQLAELDGRIDAAGRRGARLAQLEGSVAQRDIDNARIELDALRAQRRALAGGIAEREALAAPVSGVVSLAGAVAGKVVEARDVLFEIVDPQRFVVEAVAYEPAAIAVLAAGAPAAAPDLGATLRFVGAGRALREQAIPLLFRIVPPVPPLATNQQVRVIAQTAERVKGVPVPARAVARGTGGESIAWVHVAAERFEARRVEARPLDAARVSLVKGVEPGERIVVDGATLLGQVR